MYVLYRRKPERTCEIKVSYVVTFSSFITDLNLQGLKSCVTFVVVKTIPY